MQVPMPGVQNELVHANTHKKYSSKQVKWALLHAVFQGIVEADGQTENAKHRINASDKANNAKDQTLASIYDNRF